MCLESLTQTNKGMRASTPSRALMAVANPIFWTPYVSYLGSPTCRQFERRISKYEVTSDDNQATLIESIGPDLQARSSRCHESQCDNRIRQPRHEEVADRLRRVCNHQRNTSNCPRRHVQVSYQRSSGPAANCSEPIPVRSTEHQ